MTVEEFGTTLLAFCDRRPFQPFMIELMSGEQIEIDHPRSVAYRDGLAVFTNSRSKFVRINCTEVTAIRDGHAGLPYS